MGISPKFETSERKYLLRYRPTYLHFFSLFKSTISLTFLSLSFSARSSCAYKVEKCSYSQPYCPKQKASERGLHGGDPSLQVGTVCFCSNYVLRKSFSTSTVNTPDLAFHKKSDVQLILCNAEMSKLKDWEMFGR